MQLTFSQLFLPELKAEGDITRRFIQRLSDSQLLWKPHNKSHTAGILALHIAQIPDQISAAAQLETFPLDQASAAFAQPQSVGEILHTLDTGLAAAEERLAAMPDADYLRLWTATLAGKPVMTLPKHVMLRTVLFSHTCHHRGQLGVYLRLLGLSVPYAYGPSADELPPMLAAALPPR
jgi:uncharacterized damage-inducible protein DinB